MSLFQSGKFTLASGVISNFKIACEALTPDDWATLASMVARRAPRFRACLAVPRGGDRLAAALQFYATFDPAHPCLVVDDAWTTGATILGKMRHGDFGWVVFARNPIPERFPVRALFTLAACPADE